MDITPEAREQLRGILVEHPGKSIRVMFEGYG